MAGHCNCLEGNLLSSFGAAVMDVEDVEEDNVPEVFVLLTQEVPYQLEVDPQEEEDLQARDQGLKREPEATRFVA